MNETVTFEIGGNKFEFDTRFARKIETLKIGSRVRVLKKGYSDSFEVYAGVITGFDDFPALPTMTVAYVDQSYGGGLRIISINSKSKDYEIVSDVDQRSIELNKATVLETMDRAIDKKIAELDELKKSRDFFVDRFGAYFYAEKEQT
jgi:hypothetical protein